MNEFTSLRLSVSSKCEIKGILIVEDRVGNHICNKSALWDDLTGYVNTLQNENELPNNQLYVVTYFEYNGEPLDELVDYGITKQQIIDNVNNQKYVEGANCFVIEQLKQLEKMIE